MLAITLDNFIMNTLAIQPLASSQAMGMTGLVHQENLSFSAEVKRVKGKGKTVR